MGKKIRDRLKNFDLVGIVANVRRKEYQPSWIMINPEGQLDNFENLSGTIGQGNRFPPKNLDVFGEVGKECKLLDGVLLAIRSETLIKKI